MSFRIGLDKTVKVMGDLFFIFFWLLCNSPQWEIYLYCIAILLLQFKHFFLRLFSTLSNIPLCIIVPSTAPHCRDRNQPIIASSIRCQIVLELPCLRVKLHLQAPEMQDDLIVTFTSSCHALVSFSIGYFIYDAFDMVLYHRWKTKWHHYHMSMTKHKKTKPNQTELFYFHTQLVALCNFC